MNDPNDISGKLLDNLTELLAADESIGKLPIKQFIAQGEAAWDSEQFTVSFLSIDGGQPALNADFQQPQFMTWYGNWRIELVRKAPGLQQRGTAPSATTQATAAAATNADVLALLNALQACVTGDLIVRDHGVRFAITSIDVVGPRGQMCAAVATISIGLM